MPLSEIGAEKPPVDELLVSVIVPCRNEARHIEAFLNSVVRQERGNFDIEVLVADGLSDDGTREILIEQTARHRAIRMIDNPEKIVSTALNRAIQAAQGEIVVRMDVHTEYASDYIKECVVLLRESQAACVGGPALTRAEGFFARANAAAYHSRFSCGGPRFHDPRHEGLVDTVTYGCWLKRTLVTAGLFDETLVRNQDDELNLRLRTMGGKVWQSPRIKSWYRPRGSFWQLFRQYFQYGFWKVAVIRKHRLPASWRHLVPGTALLMGAALPLMSLVTVALGNTVGVVLFLIWSALLALYGLALTLASIVAARKHGWDLLPVLPLVFATYHASYGLGFLAGLTYFCTGWRSRNRTPAFSTELTR